MMKIKTISVEQINPAPYNPRKDLQPGDLEYEKLKRSLDEFGCVEPLVWNERTGNLVGGHQRFKVMLARGDNEVTVSVVNLDEPHEKALNVALNKINGVWDEEKLNDLLQELSADNLAALTGYDQHEIDKLADQFSFSDEDTAGDFSNGEINLGSFDEEKFECTCPRCGFSFNPKEPPKYAGGVEELGDDA